MSFQFNDQDPLVRCPGETQKASDALQAYWLMGPGRSLRKLVQKYNEPSTEKPPTRHHATVGGWSKRYKWQDRIARASEIEHARKRDEWRKRRVDLLEGFFGKTAGALDKFEGEDATLGQLTQAVKTAVQELRAEYDDLPTQKQEHQINVRLEKELNELFDKLEGILEPDAYERVLAAVVGDPDSAAAAEDQTNE